jgi:hypothetical protein
LSVTGYLRVALAGDAIVERATNPLTHITFDHEDVVGGVTILGLRPPCHAMGPEWLEFGDEILCADDLPAWASGPARVRSYAAAAGLDASERRVFRPTLVIEHGDLQVWCDAGVPDASELLTRDAVRVLELVGLPVPRRTGCSAWRVGRCDHPRTSTSTSTRTERAYAAIPSSSLSCAR